MANLLDKVFITAVLNILKELKEDMKASQENNV